MSLAPISLDGISRAILSPLPLLPYIGKRGGPLFSQSMRNVVCPKRRSDCLLWAHFLKIAKAVQNAAPRQNWRKGRSNMTRRRYTYTPPPMYCSVATDYEWHIACVLVVSLHSCPKPKEASRRQGDDRGVVRRTASCSGKSGHTHTPAHALHACMHE